MAERMHHILVGLTVLAAALQAGCGGQGEKYVTPERLERGLVVVLPGIENQSPLPLAIRNGLLDAGVDQAIRIEYWGRPIPLAGPLLNQIDAAGNRRIARKIAADIEAYLDSHPGRPAYLVGHSGGGGMAVFIAEALPEGRKVDGLVLLSASLSAGYEPTDALARTEQGIVNFWSPGDVGLLVLGTTVFGNVDGVHGPAVGAVGFTEHPGATAGSAKLYQVRWTGEMLRQGNLGGHAGSTNRDFIAQWVAPWVSGRPWPPAEAIPTTQALQEPGED